VTGARACKGDKYSIFFFPSIRIDQIVRFLLFASHARSFPRFAAANNAVITGTHRSVPERVIEQAENTGGKLSVSDFRARDLSRILSRDVTRLNLSLQADSDRGAHGITRVKLVRSQFR